MGFAKTREAVESYPNPTPLKALVNTIATNVQTYKTLGSTCSLFVGHLYFLYYTHTYIVLICLPILREFYFKFILLNTIELFHNSKRVGAMEIILSASYFEI